MSEIQFKGKEIEISDFGIKWIPTAQVRLLTNEETYLCEMLVDSGADITLIPRRLGEFLGFSLDGEKIREIRGIGEGAIPYTIRTMQIKIGEYFIQARIGITLIEEVPLILGRLDVFDHFNIEFRQKDRLTILRPRSRC